MVDGVEGSELTVKPFSRNVTYFHITARDVRSIHRFAKGEKFVVKDSGGIVFG